MSRLLVEIHGIICRVLLLTLIAANIHFAMI